MHAPLQRAQRTDLANPAAHGERWILTLDCEDRVGIVAGVTGFLAERGGFILDSQQYADVETGRYFMRVSFAGADPARPLDQATLEREFREVADRFHMHWQLVAESRRPRVMVAVSRTSHCLNDLLHWCRTILTSRAWRSGTAFRSTTCRCRRKPGRIKKTGCSTYSSSRTRTCWCWRATCRF